MQRLILVTLLFFVLSSAHSQKYIFYLHGQIVQEQGANAVSSEYGPYQYQAILDSFRANGFTVISEVRAKGTDREQYAQKVVTQIDSLIKTGVKPGNITVVGASAGAVIASFISSLMKNKRLNFVLVAGCSDEQLYGNFLFIFEKSDSEEHDCEAAHLNQSKTITHFKRIVINTGLKHGFLYKPIKEWMKPAMQWANGKYK